jgi:hypothetical protein
MRIAILSAISLGLVAAGAALAVGPPQPPQPATTTAQTVGAPAVESGLYGYVRRGPVTPTCAPGDACFRPARVTLRFTRAGALVATAATRATGRYRVALAPGLYTVSVPRSQGLLKPGVVRVAAESWRRVIFVLSTGIY